MFAQVRAAGSAVRRQARSSSWPRWAERTEQVAPLAPGKVRATFLGVSTILFDDGETAVLVDGFFTRPGRLRVLLGRVGPDESRSRAALDLDGMDRLAAVLVAHSHYDHALDSARVARLTGARLMGSESTRNLGLGEGLAEERITVVDPGSPVTVGRFTVTAHLSRHSPGDIAPGEIASTMSAPARVRKFRTGECYSFHLAHGGRELLVHASANHLDGALDGVRAETVYLGIGVLGKQTDEFREQYWDALVRGTGARRVVPVHWDDFTRPLDRPLTPPPAPFDDVPAALEWLDRRAAAEGVRWDMPLVGRPADPWP